MKNIIALFFLNFLLINHLSLANAAAGESRILDGGGYSSSLNIFVENNCVYFEVKHVNTGSREIYISPDNPIFMIRDPLGKVVRYTGPLVREAIQDSDSFRKLLPNQTYSFRILINRYYDIRQLGEYIATLNLDYYDPILHNVTYRGSVSHVFLNQGVCNARP